MAKLESYKCDINDCDNEVANPAKDMQVIFTTEQNEGRACKPYLSMVKLDICNVCLDKILSKGKYISAEGAMGYNDYNIYYK